NERRPYFGAAVNLQLTVTNNGPDRASGIVARWTVPYSGISYQIDRCTKQGENVLFCTAGDLAPGASTTFLAGAYIPADTRTMVASVSSSADDPNPANNDASLEIVPVVTPYPQPVLTVFPPPAEGRPSAYGLTIENRGGGTANDVHVRWTFEGDLELGGADCKTIDAATLDCVVPSVAAHQTSGALHVFVTPGSAGGRIASRAVATFAGGETDPGPLSAAIENVIAPNPVLKVSIAPPTELDGNGNLTFRYTVSNVSSADATRLVGRMSFPSGSTFVGASGADCRETMLPPYNELEMTCTMPDLRAGQSLVA